MKVVDIDKLFERYLKDYMKKNSGKFTEEEWESEMPKLYQEFGGNSIKELDMLSPIEYFKNLTNEEIILLLKDLVGKDISVSDFMCDAIIEKKCEDELIKLLDDSDDELQAYAINLLKDIDSKKPLLKYFDMLESGSLSKNLTELIGEILVDNCNLIKEKALELYYSDICKDIMVEILARCERDDKIFKILIDEFLNNFDNIPLYANYLAVYGDERAISYLITEIEKDVINYSDFQELKFAIEALGGEYLKERDFSGDVVYKKIKNEKFEE